MSFLSPDRAHARACLGSAILLGLMLSSFSPLPAGAEALAHTYSIVARDPETGQFGVAVQSHWFQVGSVVAWAEAGVGAVATQSFVKVEYGPQGLALMAEGKSAEQALEALLAKDEERDTRQVAMIDAKGNTATWTGARCIAAAGDRSGKGYSVQANLMEKDTVWDAMARAYESAEGDFADRLVAALAAAEAEGGDIRGRQSAALLIVRAKPTGEPWKDRLVDLRVEDHEAPVKEMRRLLSLHRAYEQMNLGDEAVTVGDFEAGARHYSRAAELAPHIAEIPYWKAVTLFSVGKETEALPIFRDVFARESRWIEVTRRLPAAGLLPADPEKLEKILAVAPQTDGGEPK